MNIKFGRQLLFILAALGAFLGALSGNSAANEPEHYYIYQGKKIELKIDPGQIAVKSSAAAAQAKTSPAAAAASAAAVATQLSTAGFAATDAKPHAIPGWVVLKTKTAMGMGAAAAAATQSEAVKATVNAVAANPAVDFVSPVAKDPRGNAIIVTPSILMEFRKGVSEGAKQKVLAGAGRVLSKQGDQGPMTVDFDVRSGFDVLATANALSAMAEVLYAEPDLIQTGITDLLPTDPSFSSSWHLRNTGQSGGLAGFDLSAETAWDITTGSSSIIVVVFDSGVQQNHPDINQRTGADFTSDSASNPNGGPVGANDGHGTAVAGCISGRINNGLGTTGIAPGVRVASARIGTNYVRNSDGTTGFTFQPSWLVNGLNWAQSIGARVTNNSNTLGSPSSAIDSAYASTRSAGLVHFASSGNNGTGSIGYPSSSPSVNAVGSATRFGNRTSSSQYGVGLKFMAPGAEIVTTDITGSGGFGSGDYVTIGGTSFACPLAAGVAALVLSQNPSWTAAQVESRLQTTARDMGPGGYDTTNGYGLLNARAALNAGASGPANDNFTSRTALTGTNPNVATNNANATKQSGEPNHAGNSGGKSLWWSWTAPGNGSVTVTTSGSNFDTLLAAYTGSSLTGLTAVASNDDYGSGNTSQITFTAQSGVTYQIAVDGYNGASGNIAMNLVFAVTAPGNDNFANRITLSGSNPTATGSNVGASKESGEPNHAGNSGGRSVWWRWVAPSSGTVTISTAGSSFDTILGIYTGGAANALAGVVSDDDGGTNNTSLVTFSAQSGQPYQIAVDGYGGASGSIALSISFQSSQAPSNDNFVNAVSVTTGFVYFGSNVNGTKEANEPRHNENDGGKSVWWRWTAPANGTVTLDTIGSNFDTLLAVYTGNTVSTLTEVASDDDSGGSRTSRVNFQAVSGTTYRIAVDGWADTSGLAASGSVTLNLSLAAESKAQLQSPAAGSTLTSASTTFSWSAGSGASAYWLYVGSTAGASDIYNSNQTSALSQTVSPLPTDGRTLYVRLWSLIGSSWFYNDYTFTASGTQPQVNLTFFQPSGWSDKVIISNVPGNNLDSATFLTTDSLYVDFAPWNNGTSAVPSGWTAQIFVDNVVVFTDAGFSPGLAGNTYINNVLDKPIGSLSAGTHTIRVTLDTGGTVSETNESDNSYTKTITVYQGSRRVSRDLNGDGNADILLQNSAGQVYAWYMNGSGGILSGTYIYNGALPGWTVVGVADMNGDGNADIILQYANGSAYMWSMNGSGGILSGSYIYNGALPGWRVAGVADMNGDGNADILLQNTNGSAYMWSMNGSGGILSGSYIYNGALPGWRVAGIADMNGDGNADILLQNTNGSAYMWSMNGSGGIISGSYIYSGALPGWSVVGAADMNGDGNADIILQYANGAVYAWTMNGSGGIFSGAYIYNGALPGWSVR
jgi:subtilisin family serine protease